MPPGPYLPGLVRINLTYTDDTAATHENVLYALLSTIAPLSTATLTNIQTAVNGAMAANWPGIGAAIWHYTGSIVTDQQSNTGLQVTNAGYAAVAGSIAGQTPSASLSILVSEKVAQRYKGGHGRVYFPGCPGSKLADAKHWQAASVTIAQGTMTAVQAAVQGLAPPQQCQIVVLRGRRTAAPTTNLILSFLGQNLVASQRRRTRKAAHH